MPFNRKLSAALASAHPNIQSWKSSLLSSHQLCALPSHHRAPFPVKPRHLWVSPHSLQSSDTALFSSSVGKALSPLSSFMHVVSTLFPFSPHHLSNAYLSFRLCLNLTLEAFSIAPRVHVVPLCASVESHSLLTVPLSLLHYKCLTTFLDASFN